MTHEERARLVLLQHQRDIASAQFSKAPLRSIEPLLAAAFAEVERDALERAAEVAHKQAVAYARYHATAGERGREIRKEKAGMAKQIEAAIRALAAEER